LTRPEIFVDVDGDKYLARIVRTFPPKSASSSTPSKYSRSAGPYHVLASDLDVANEDILRIDDPMGYFYNVRLIEGEQSPDEANGHVEGEDEPEKWEGSVMEVQADKISSVPPYSP
jgi:bromodomain adjacent to zinc finger domain protein 1A